VAREESTAGCGEGGASDGAVAGPAWARACGNGSGSGERRCKGENGYGERGCELTCLS
jgi:hypothetical protein